MTWPLHKCVRCHHWRWAQTNLCTPCLTWMVAQSLAPMVAARLLRDLDAEGDAESEPRTWQ